MKRAALLILCFMFVVGLIGYGCGKKAEKPAPPPQVPPMGKPYVEAPPEVKGKWKGAVLVIEDLQKKTKTDHPMSIGETYALPESDLTVTVDDFFPDFAMQGPKITSLSNELKNPAVMITVTRGGNVIFNGWLLGKYPNTRAFADPRYSIILKEGVAN